MELRRKRIVQRKSINNLPRYTDGADTNGSTTSGVATSGWKNRVRDNAGGAVTGAIQFTGDAINAFSGTPETSELVAQAGNAAGQGTGFTYNKIGNIDAAGSMKELSASNTANTLKAAGSGAALGASVGSFFPGIGTAIGAVAGGIIGGAVGLFGGASRKRALKRRLSEAQNQIQRTNEYRLASAQSDYMQNQFELDHGDTKGGQLYVANKGKDLKRPNIRRK